MAGSNVATLEPRAIIAAGPRPTAIIPQTMDDAYRMAKAVCLAGLAPKGLDKPESCMVAILHGMEIGLTPMTALQRIAVVNGRPTLWGDGAMSLVRGSGLCDFVKETQGGTGDAFAATCEAKRKGEADSVLRTFSVADAKKAGLWGKSGPWQQYPNRMLQMRARAFCLRDLFADVLGGLYLREEIEDEGRSARVAELAQGGATTSQRATATVRRPAAALPAPVADAPAADLSDAAADEVRDALIDEGRSAAMDGTEALAAWEAGLTHDDRELITADELDVLRKTAAEVA